MPAAARCRHACVSPPYIVIASGLPSAWRWSCFRRRPSAVRVTTQVREWSSPTWNGMRDLAARCIAYMHHQRLALERIRRGRSGLVGDDAAREGLAAQGGEAARKASAGVIDDDAGRRRDESAQPATGQRAAMTRSRRNLFMAPLPASASAASRCNLGKRHFAQASGRRRLTSEEAALAGGAPASPRRLLSVFGAPLFRPAWPRRRLDPASGAFAAVGQVALLVAVLLEIGLVPAAAGQAGTTAR